MLISTVNYHIQDHRIWQKIDVENTETGELLPWITPTSSYTKYRREHRERDSVIPYRELLRKLRE
jgi:hypothetical protein